MTTKETTTNDHKPNRTPAIPMPDFSKWGAMNWVMAACCTAMVIGFATLVLAGSSGDSLLSRALIAAPLLLCVAVHFVLHRHLGKHPQDGRATRNDNSWRDD